MPDTADTPDRRSPPPAGSSPDHPAHRLSVGVTVDLELVAGAGGHVKSWQRFAEATTAFPHGLDLTVYFLGDRETVTPLSDTVRYHCLPARRSTRRLGLQQGAGHTDLAARHPGLQKLLPRHDLLHTTSAFALSRTAARAAAARGIPLTGSLHTDLPYFTRAYAGETIGNLIGNRAAGRLLSDHLGIADISAWRMDRQVRRVLAPGAHAFYAGAATRDWLAARLPDMPATLLRRGVDKALFDPARRDRARLQAAFGIPAAAVVLLFVGRVDASKKAMVAADAARALRDAGYPVHLLALGEGAEQAAIKALLGPDATLPGNVPQEDLAWIYASADLFVFPSLSETIGNVVIEARAAGLPVAVAGGTAPAGLVARPGLDGLVVAGEAAREDPRAWADALLPLVADAAQRQAMGQAARAAVVADVPDWRDVVAEDLLPVWRRAVAGHPAAGVAA